MTMLLETNGLCKDFKKQRAVNQVSMHIRANRIYGLLGPNGAGKSTTLKMITGMLRPTEGSITVFGKPWSRAMLRDIGALIEQPPLYDNLTARENLEVYALLCGAGEADIARALQQVNLTDTGRKKAGAFSLGMKQRLGIAQALLKQPRLLILDEPTNGLDPIGIEELRELIRSFPQQGITVILSSHILPEVAQVADDIGIISNGVLGYEGSYERGADLEALFMETVKNSRKAGVLE